MEQNRRVVHVAGSMGLKVLDATHVGRMHAGMRVLNMVTCAASIAASNIAGTHRNARKVIWLKLPKSHLAKIA